MWYQKEAHENRASFCPYSIVEEELFAKPLAICADGGEEIVTEQINESVLVLNQKNVDFSSLEVQTLVVSEGVISVHVFQWHMVWNDTHRQMDTFNALNEI